MAYLFYESTHVIAVPFSILVFHFRFVPFYDYFHDILAVDSVKFFVSC